jgi:hypothetical protein
MPSTCEACASLMLSSCWSEPRQRLERGDFGWNKVSAYAWRMPGIRLTMTGSMLSICSAIKHYVLTGAWRRARYLHEPQ